MHESKFLSELVRLNLASDAFYLVAAFFACPGAAWPGRRLAGAVFVWFCVFLCRHALSLRPAKRRTGLGLCGSASGL